MAAVYPAWECILQVILDYPITVRDSAVNLMIRKPQTLKKPPTTQSKTQHKTKLLFITYYKGREEVVFVLLVIMSESMQ